MFRGIDYENLKDGDLITFYGVHVLRWEDDIRPYGIEPTIAFVQDDSGTVSQAMYDNLLDKWREERKQIALLREALTELYEAWEGYEMMAALDYNLQEKVEKALATTDPTG